MNTKRAPYLGISSSALLAVAEDSAGIGLDVGPALADRLHRLAQGGIGLPRPIARTLRREFGFDLSRIRLHAGPDVDDIANELNASAFCLGTGIFLSRFALAGGDSARLNILAMN